MMIRKGLLWQQRDRRLFSRWKERFFVLTKDYLQCYKKGSSRISEMGGFIFKIKLSEVRTVENLHIALSSGDYVNRNNLVASLKNLFHVKVRRDPKHEMY